jgi:uncharacterized protein YbjT (DUF2867 family)
MKIVVIGGRGLIGSKVASKLSAQVMPDSGYNTAKAAQETLIKDSGRPDSIVRGTPFYETVAWPESGCDLFGRVDPVRRRSSDIEATRPVHLPTAQEESHSR